MCFQRLNNKHWACMGLHLVIYVMVLAWQFCETSNTGSTGLSLTFWSALGTPFFLLGCLSSLKMNIFCLVLLCLVFPVCLVVVSWRPFPLWRGDAGQVDLEESRGGGVTWKDCRERKLLAGYIVWKKNLCSINVVKNRYKWKYVISTWKKWIGPCWLCREIKQY